ncbi:hypothetical protein [Dehalobacterium formicoaceticum]|uniref:hypothetical protein n=1 Tax=Dehalobacterium formicoaceticum TaxID=51515 RepID=UPI0018DF229B|nr:hypothetical protein [Dehalobacterium formicoaceticum]
MASDITVQKKAEEEFQRYSDELKRKEKETLELIDSFTEGSWIVDPVAGTIMCSEKWAKCIDLDLVRVLLAHFISVLFGPSASVSTLCPRKNVWHIRIH